GVPRETSFAAQRESRPDSPAFHGQTQTGSRTLLCSAVDARRSDVGRNLCLRTRSHSNRDSRQLLHAFGRTLAAGNATGISHSPTFSDRVAPSDVLRESHRVAIGPDRWPAAAPGGGCGDPASEQRSVPRSNPGRRQYSIRTKLNLNT